MSRVRTLSPERIEALESEIQGYLALGPRDSQVLDGSQVVPARFLHLRIS